MARQPRLQLDFRSPVIKKKTIRGKKEAARHTNFIVKMFTARGVRELSPKNANYTAKATVLTMTQCELARTPTASGPPTVFHTVHSTISMTTFIIRVHQIHK
jgi:hypothetical protein